MQPYLAEHLLDSSLRDTMLIKVHKSDFLEPVHNLIRRLPLLRLRQCRAELAEVDERNTETRVLLYNG